MKVFIEVNGLTELEHAGKWDEAKTLLYNLWDADKSNVSKLLRLISECWYVLTEWNCFIQNKALSFDAFRKALVGAIQYGLAHFNRNADFLWISGYMISLFPELFCDGEEGISLSKWEQKGVDMLLAANQIDASNPIAKVLYLGTQSASDEYAICKARLTPQLNNFFPGHTAIEEYFKEVLSE